jgi:hypothetical protein
MQLKLKKFDISSITCDKIVLFLASRGAGKSYCVKDLMYYHRDIPIGAVISPTEKKNKFYSHFIPSLFIHNEYSPELVQNILKRQTVIMNKKNKEETMYGKSNIDPRVFFIMDDCMHDDSWKKDKNMNYIFNNGRHDKMLFILTLQYIIGISPSMRSNIDYVFIFRENNYQNRKKIYDQYCGVFPTFDMFCKVLDVVTEGYGCMVINKTSRSNKLEDIVFWYQAEIRDNFTVGSREMWQAHNELTADEEDEEEEMYDLQTFLSKHKKSKVNINIKKI